MSNELRISDRLAIPLDEIDIRAVRARGPGGQNVNKVATAVRLRFDIGGSVSLPDHVKRRLLALGDRRISSDGVVTIKAQQFRTQAANRRAALKRLGDLIAGALVRKKPRIPTRPSGQARARRLEEKRRRGRLKEERRPVDED